MYHANPVDKHGSLVSRDWGADLVDIVYQISGLVTTVFATRDRNMGIDGEFLEVFVSCKA